MRESEKIKNMQDDKKHIDRPVIWVTAILIVIIGIMIWFGVRNPVVFSAIRDFLITFLALLFFILGVALSVLCFLLISKINIAKIKIDEAVTFADGKVVVLGEKIEEILKQILEPVIKAQSETAGFLHIFSKRKMEGSK
ncbi:MAG: hypothetical protein II969_11375 [Anaerolineaceae bacterium]|nr:hypothetical protein [Anaerolineaceae bacterium]